MKWLHWLCGIVLFLLLLNLGVSAVYGSTFGHGYWLAFLEQLKLQRLATFGFGVTVLFLLLVYVLTLFQRKRHEQFISFDGSKGPISINARAVRDIIQRVENEFAAILSLQPVLEFKKGGLFVELNVRVAAGTQIPELCQMVQDRVTECLHDQLGLSEIRGVKVNVQEITSRIPEVRSSQEGSPK